MLTLSPYLMLPYHTLTLSHQVLTLSPYLTLTLCYVNPFLREPFLMLTLITLTITLPLSHYVNPISLSYINSIIR